MRNAWTIAKREYHQFFRSPIAYVVAFVMMLTLGIMFPITILYFRGTRWVEAATARRPRPT